MRIHVCLHGSSTWLFESQDFGAKEWLDGDVAPRKLYNWTTNPDVMAHTWQAAIDANKDKDMIWTVGLRGLWDYAMCPKDMSDATCGELVSGAVANQTAWIRAAEGHDAKIITYLWSELLALFKSGTCHRRHSLKQLCMPC